MILVDKTLTVSLAPNVVLNTKYVAVTLYKITVEIIYHASSSCGKWP